MIEQDLTKKGGHISLVQYEIDKTPKEYRKDGGMQVGNIHLKPILIYLPDEVGWVAKWRLAQEHLAQEGFENVYELAGIHAERTGLTGTHIYLMDNPDEKHFVGNHNVGNYITQYSAYLVMDALDYSHYWYCEGDMRMVKGWREKLTQALEDAGDDWDMIFIGSCCISTNDATHIKGDVYEFNKGRYACCTHSYILNKRCVKHMIATNRDVANPTDISMIVNSYPKMRVLGIFPILSYQEGNKIFQYQQQ